MFHRNLNLFKTRIKSTLKTKGIFIVVVFSYTYFTAVNPRIIYDKSNTGKGT